MSRKRIGNLKDCVCRTDDASVAGGIAGLSDIMIRVDTPGGAPGARAASSAVAKPRKPRSKGTGQHCVISHKGRTVHCYEDRATADRVASAFTKRGKAKTPFTVRDRSDDS